MDINLITLVTIFLAMGVFNFLWRILAAHLGTRGGEMELIGQAMSMLY